MAGVGAGAVRTLGACMARVFRAGAVRGVWVGGSVAFLLLEGWGSAFCCMWGVVQFLFEAWVREGSIYGRVAAYHKASRYGQEGGRLSWPGDDLEFRAHLIGVARGVGLWVERS